MKKLYLFFHIVMATISVYFISKVAIQLYLGQDCWSSTAILFIIVLNSWLMGYSSILKAGKRGTKEKNIKLNWPVILIIVVEVCIILYFISLFFGVYFQDCINLRDFVK